ncbi:MAG: RICIN domain-containing protein [Lachnospiraceae bacterium]
MYRYSARAIQTYSNIQQYTFNGSDDQKWKVEDAGEGYVKFVSQSGTKSKLLDVVNGWSADGTNIQLYPDHGHDAQKFKLKASSRRRLSASCQVQQ